MWEAIRSNQRRSWLLIILMGVFLLSLGFVLGFVIEPGYGGMAGCVFALAVWLVLYLIAVISGDGVLLFSTKACKIAKQDAPMLWNVVEEMTIASGLGKMPSVYIIDDDMPNAFAVGLKAECAAIAVTSGLLKRLNRDELQGVIAHEIGHIHNLDIKFMTQASVMVGAVVLISDLFLRLIGGSRGRSSSSDLPFPLLLILAVIFSIIVPLLVRLLYFACSRKREYLADASSALYTRYPEGLASALDKISQQPARIKEINRAIAPMFIVNPLAQKSGIGLLSTHPPVEKRISVLRNMAGAGLISYEQAYKQIFGTNASCLGTKTLTDTVDIEKRLDVPENPDREEVVNRIQIVNDVLSQNLGYSRIACSCGLIIKIPPAFKHNTMACPKCGTVHSVPSSKPVQSLFA